MVKVSENRRVIYADDDLSRLRTLARFLKRIGCEVIELPTLNGFSDAQWPSPPRVVLLCKALHDKLGPLAACLWPNATLLVLSEGDKYDEVAGQIQALL
jgi:hypothetical protein